MKNIAAQLAIILVLLACSASKDTQPAKAKPVIQQTQPAVQQTTEPITKAADPLEFTNLPSGRYRIEELRKALRGISTNNVAEIKIYDDIELINDLYTYQHTPGTYELTVVAKSDKNETIEEVINITLEDEKPAEEKNENDASKEKDDNNVDNAVEEEVAAPSGNAVIYNIFQPGTYRVSIMKDKLQSLRVETNNTLTIYHNDLPVSDIHTWSPSLGDAVIKLQVIEPSGAKTERTIAVNVEKNKLQLKRVSASSTLWTTEGCGILVKRWGIHQPKVLAGFKPISHVVSTESYSLSGSIDLYMVAAEQPGIVVEPIEYVEMYYTYGGGCDDANVRIWRPKAPAGFVCLSDVAVPADKEPKDVVPLLCIHESFIQKTSVGSTSKAHDQHSGIDYHKNLELHECDGSTTFTPKSIRATEWNQTPATGDCRAIDDNLVEWID